MHRTDSALSVFGLVVFCAIALFAGAGCDKPDTRGQSVPSVFVIVLDASNAKYFGCYGDKHGTSPNIDAFAAEGVLFENAYSQTATTVSSTASLMTGTRATTHHMTDRTRLPESLPTLAESLSKQGMSCYGVIGNPFAGAPATGLNRGYKECIEVYALEALQDKRASEESSKFKVTLPEDITGQVEKLLPKLKTSGDFTYIHILQPHKPYTPPDRFLREFKCDGSDWDKLHDAWMASLNSGKVAPETTQLLKSRYRANIKYVDEAVGRLLSDLKKAGLYEESLIILMSDHGEAFFTHKFFGHNATLYDDMTRIPMMMKFPKSQKVAPKRIANLVETIDVMPTIFDYIGLDVPDSHEGDSLWPLITGDKKELPGPEIITCTVQRTKHAIRIGDYKYIFSETGVPELYDIRHDPCELRNLAAKDSERAGKWLEKLQVRVDLLNRGAATGNSKLRDDPAMDAVLNTLGYAGGANEEFVTPGATTQPAGDATPATGLENGDPDC